MDATNFTSTYGPWAIVVGAGAGLGESYARQLVAAGMSVVLVDRDGEAIAALAKDLNAPTAVRTLTVDLTEPDGVATILAAIADLDVGLLIANAASSYVGAFTAQSWESVAMQVRVNVEAPTRLVHQLLPRLLERPRAGIILMSSQSSRRGAPLVSTYAATKAYLGILAEGLWDELGPLGVDVLAVLPGSTRTPGWLSSRPQSGMGTASLMGPDDVVREALTTLGSGVASIVSGETNRASESFLESMDRAGAIQTVGRVMRDMYPDERDVDERV